jgi:Flp pilus assembly pilin Flp
MKQHLSAIIAGTRVQLDRRGVTAVEYGIVAAFLCLSLLAVFAKFGNVLSTMFSKVTTSI